VVLLGHWDGACAGPDKTEEVMRWSSTIRGAFLGVSIFCLGMPEAQAIEVVSSPGLAAHMDDGVVIQVRGGRGGGMRHGGGGMRGGGMRGGGAYRGGGARFAGGGYRGRGGAYRGGGARVAGGAYRGRAGYGYRGGARYAGGAYRGGYGRYGYRGGYGYRGYGYGGYGYRPGYGYGAAAVRAAAAAHHCWINHYGYRECNYNYY
jgi:hypothetical protein